VQESLTNASKYAEAKQVSVTLACTTEHLVLTVRDDGRGCRPISTLAALPAITACSAWSSAYWRWAAR
jgi:signal transduction histidine kinase